MKLSKFLKTNPVSLIISEILQDFNRQIKNEYYHVVRQMIDVKTLVNFEKSYKPVHPISDDYHLSTLWKELNYSAIANEIQGHPEYLTPNQKEYIFATLLSLATEQDLGKAFSYSREDTVIRPSNEEMLVGMVHIVESHPSIKKEFSEFVSQNYEKFMSVALSFQHFTVEERYAYYFADEFKSYTKDDSAILKLNIKSKMESFIPKTLFGVDSHKISPDTIIAATVANYRYFLSDPLKADPEGVQANQKESLDEFITAMAQAHKSINWKEPATIIEPGAFKSIQGYSLNIDSQKFPQSLKHMNKLKHLESSIKSHAPNVKNLVREFGLSLSLYKIHESFIAENLTKENKIKAVPLINSLIFLKEKQLNDPTFSLDRKQLNIILEADAIFKNHMLYPNPAPHTHPLDKRDLSLSKGSNGLEILKDHNNLVLILEEIHQSLQNQKSLSSEASKPKRNSKRKAS